MKHGGFASHYSLNCSTQPLSGYFWLLGPADMQGTLPTEMGGLAQLGEESSLSLPYVGLSSNCYANRVTFYTYCRILGNSYDECYGPPFQRTWTFEETKYVSLPDIQFILLSPSSYENAFLCV